jgi:hypothetical protein
MALNGSGIRDTARVLRISPTTVIAIVKKATVLRHANPTLLLPRRSRAVRVSVECAAELDEMWSFVGAKKRARWLWHALAPHTGRVLAYMVGTRKDTVFLKLKACGRLLASRGIIQTRRGSISGIFRTRSTQEESGRGSRSNVNSSRCGSVSNASPARRCVFPFVYHARPRHRVIYESR